MAKNNVIFNYVEKNMIHESLNDPRKSLVDFFLSKKIDYSFLDPKVFSKNIDSIDELKKNIDSDKNGSSILESVFSAFIFNFFNSDKVYKINSKCNNSYEDYFDFLKNNFKNLISRNKGLVIVDF